MARFMIETKELRGTVSFLFRSETGHRYIATVVGNQVEIALGTAVERPITLTSGDMLALEAIASKLNTLLEDIVDEEDENLSAESFQHLRAVG